MRFYCTLFPHFLTKNNLLITSCRSELDDLESEGNISISDNNSIGSRTSGGGGGGGTGTSTPTSIKDRRPPTSQPHPHMYPRGVYRNMRSDVFLGEGVLAGGVGLIEVQPASLRPTATAMAATSTSSGDRVDREREHPLTARSTGSFCLSTVNPIGAGISGSGHGSLYQSSNTDGGSARGPVSSPRVSSLLNSMGMGVLQYPSSSSSVLSGGGLGQHLTPPNGGNSLERSMVLPPLHNNHSHSQNNISSTSSVCSNVTYDNASLADSGKSVNSQEENSSGGRRRRSSSLLADIAEADETNHHRREATSNEGYGEGALDSSRYPGSNVSSLPASTGKFFFI